MITANREALKTLANINIDNQAFFRKAVDVFNYGGEITPEYTALCVEIKGIFSDIENSVKALKPFMDNLTSGN